MGDTGDFKSYIVWGSEYDVARREGKPVVYSFHSEAEVEAFEYGVGLALGCDHALICESMEAGEKYIQTCARVLIDKLESRQVDWTVSNRGD